MSILLDIGSRLQSAGFFVPGFVNTVQPIPGGQYIPYTNAPKLYVQNNIAFEDLELKYGDKLLNFKNTVLTKGGSLGNIFAPPPMLSWSKSVNVEVTVIDGTDAEVVERFGAGQWDIMFEGVLVDMENHEFPIGKLAEIREFFEIADAKDVTSEILNDGLNVKSIWFKTFSGSGVAGFADTIRYSIPARSIVPVEFYLNNETL